MSSEQTTHESSVFEDDEGAVFIACDCGWMSQGIADREVGDEDPPYALASAYNEHYGHRYRVTQLGLES